ncbi:maleylpyruvate isomerase N-terminal domain-containing protein [Actinomadura sp. DC4]|uniref:maleylpyruvate isomerase N-terminal domain-containing protein n=1 Tax=Actinomadura sp. DC4 TaxID=3055069 RepID=UPI0025B1E102|nr:maleylpyruvate isomerase N-terminal domain-containing protein [Actinomadura sp. DC4]MDN3356862.1 maleylpyruvate isomerase N-terminal domain-containing protein [Actinomadura sp. DC4]
MTEIRGLFLAAATAAADLLAAPEVAAAWHEPSALAKLSVRGLAGHLAGQVLFVPPMLDGPEATEEVISVHDYYARAAWIGSDLDDEFNTGMRALGEKDAAQGPEALAARVAATVEELRSALPSAPSRPVRRSSWGPTRSPWTASSPPGCWRSRCTATTWRTAWAY